MEKKVADLLKQQVTKEFYSAYLYLAFSNYYFGANLDGFGHWFEVQAQEEVTHAMKFLKYLQDNDDPATLETIEAPNIKFTSNREPLVASLHHEQYVTSLINAIYAEARNANDFRCCQFLDWFIAEQAEEEKSTSDLIAKYDLVEGNDPRGLYLLNQELASRPAATATDQAAE